MNIRYEFVEKYRYSVKVDLLEQDVFDYIVFLEIEQGYVIYLAVPKNCGIYQPLKNDTGASEIYKPGIVLS